jgi:hypothetical protein
VQTAAAVVHVVRAKPADLDTALRAAAALGGGVAALTGAVLGPELGPPSSLAGVDLPPDDVLAALAAGLAALRSS